MKSEIVLEYSSEGAPLLIADVASAQHWRGTEYDGAGVIVEYMARDLPKQLIAGKKPGMQEKKFKTLAEAKAFEKALLPKLRKLHPKAIPRPAGSSFYYVGDERVFSTELSYSSQFSTTMNAFKRTVHPIKLDKKSAAQVVFMEQDGGGPGILVADRNANVLAIAKLSAGARGPAAASALAKQRIPAGKTTLALDGRIVVFDAAYSAAEIAKLSWKTDDFAKGAAAAFEKSRYGPLRIRDQKQPCVGFVALEPGKYELSYDEALELGKSSAIALWLRRV